MENVTSKKSKHALFLRGFDDAPITDVTLRNCTLDGVEKPDVISNVQNLILENVKINGKLLPQRLSATEDTEHTEK
jgi:hypothetical protein